MFTLALNLLQSISQLGHIDRSLTHEITIQKIHLTESLLSMRRAIDLPILLPFAL
jgi:hypothetical protein